MHKLLKVPLIFLFAAACLGLFLRYQLIAPFPGIAYSNVLHAHSHAMFLGWVFNVLIIGFTIEFGVPRRFKLLFYLLQLSILGMLVSFPIQGYGYVSIGLTTLHTFGAVALIVQFFRSMKGQSSLPLTFARTALLFFVLSSLGPFFLGYLKASGLDHTNLYRNSIYFYLHFQYNGFFLFGVLSLFLKLIEEELPVNEQRRVRFGGVILIIACFPAYLLSTLWSEPPMVVNVIAFIAALAQVAALWLFVPTIINYLERSRFDRSTKLFFLLSFTSLILKSILQAISAHPEAAAFANEYRSIVIAYLHLVLLGFISLFLIAWLASKKVIRPLSPITAGLIIAGYVGSEILLVISPWCDAYFNIPITLLNRLLFGFSIMIVLGLAFLISNMFRKA